MNIHKNDYTFSYKNIENDMIYNYEISDDIYVLATEEEQKAFTLVDYDIKLDYTTLNKYDINTEDYENQVVGNIKISFSQNSSTYDKEYDLILRDIELIPWLERKNTQKNGQISLPKPKLSVWILPVFCIF